jgi:hypothetical protein
MMKRTLELEANLGVNVGGVLAWAFLVENAPLFAAYRVLASNGIDLPVLNAFKLLGGLSGNTIPVTSSGALPLASILANGVRAQPDIDAMATLNGKQVNVLVWNYHDVLETVAASPVSLNIKVPASFGTLATVSHLRADETHGDAYAVWVSQGSPATPTATQLTALQQAMVPSLLEPDETVAVTAGSVNLTFDLPRFGLSLITVSAGETLDASVDSAQPEASLGDGAVSSGDATSVSMSDGAGSSMSDAGSAGMSDAAAATDGTPGPAGGDDAGGNSQGAATGNGAGCGCSVGPRGLSQSALSALLAAMVLLARRVPRRNPRSTRKGRGRTTAGS